MAVQNPVAKQPFPDLPADFQLHYSSLIDVVNSLQGYNGPTVLNNHLDLNGYQVKNVGAPTSSTDAITHGVAEASYSAYALAPKLESTGKNSLKTMRQLNSPVQRESSSSYMNDLLSTPPNANSIVPLTAVGSGGVTVTIPSSIFTFADGSTLHLEGRTDYNLPFAATYPISSITSAGNVVTLQTTSPTGLNVGNVMTVTGVSPVGFNGAFIVTGTGAGNTLYYEDNLGTISGSGGNVELSNVYYYYVKSRSWLVNLSNGFNGDTAANRLQVSKDGNQIVAVVVLTGSGVQLASCGGGGSVITGSPAAGSCF